ncbi:GNAT family N-acetyltransferase [Vibrio vulnificus]|uniref:GNAT family N-acetyltransferase n=1 Tax=Vibrio vulnificus TaxID=672 RepID=UPI00139D11A6|nr:GNAT family N-acetyltransferase [Vibrio parahaemolyticus]EID4424011.1 GNAT family N-acetyltransferase [Vibrio vulnificus]EHH2556977.1 GNAT family N-acetyltransferase [Vibrio parahaemolyticus]ELA8139270.1 GNAT family N-acetyltransferase [Vibrio parahaemolyticus]ELK8511054.1 GNAT family N-acetyltransferase [Vibrio vulnificus]
MNLRKFVAQDALEVISWFSTEKESLYWGGWMFGWPLSDAEIINRSELPEIEFLILSNGNATLGFIELQHISETEIRLCRVAINPEYRGLGFGRALIALSIAEVRKRKQFSVATLAVFADNVTAYNCYKSYGFVTVDKEPKFREFNGQKWPLIQMETAL